MELNIETRYSPGGPSTMVQGNGVPQFSARWRRFCGMRAHQIALLALVFTQPFAAAATLSIVTQSPLPPGPVGVPYSQALSASNGVSPYKWAVTQGTLPSGIGLTALGGVLNGLLNGVPTASGTFSFTVQVTDNTNATATKQFSLTITSSVSITAKGVVNAASYAGGAVSPGEMITIFGAGLGPTTLVTLQLDSGGYVSTSLAGTRVLFDGVVSPIIYTVAGQVSAVVPYSVSGKTSTQLQVSYQGQNSNLVPIPVTTVAPGIFTVDASGRGPGAVVNQDGTVNSAANPVPAGSYVFVYATGEGQTVPGGVDGKPGDAPAPLPLAQPVTATVGGVNTQVQYAGGVPGLVAGVVQVNVQVPQGIPTGNSVPILVNIAGVTSQTGVTIAVKGSGTGNPAAPTLTSVSPATGVPGNSLPVTLTGTNFVAGATIAVSNPAVTVSNVNVVSGTQITATITIAPGASAGSTNVTVTTSGGTSGPVSFTVSGGASIPTLVSISPNSGVPGSNVPVTLTGTNYVAGASIAVSNPGVTVSNVNVVSGTQIAATFTIAAGATTGSSNVTVTTTTGTSAAVSFTISASSATPTISINPADGATASTTPSITITYSGGPAGVDLKSLSILIDGIDSTVFFSITSSSATLSPTLSGGQHIINSSIKTTSGTLLQASSHFTVSEFNALPQASPTSGAAPLTVNFVTNAAYTAGAITRYQWDFEGTGTWDQDDPSPFYYSHKFTTPGVRNSLLKVTNDRGQTTSATVQITITAPPTATASLSPTNGGTPLVVKFSATTTATTGTIAKYEWDFNGDGTFEYNSSSTATTTFTYTIPGTYVAVLRVTDSQGTTTTVSGTRTTVRVGPAGSPTATITYPISPSPQAAPASELFDGTGTSSTSKIVRYEWDFNGDGAYDYSSIATASVFHTYNIPSAYTASLRVTDSAGLTGIDSVDIVITGSQLTVSTDTLHPAQGETTNVQTVLPTSASVNVYIKNLAGKTVRTLANNVQRSAGQSNDTWDGKDDTGQVVPDGVYYAILQYTGPSGKQTTVDLTTTTGGVWLLNSIYDTFAFALTTIDGASCTGFASNCSLAPYANNFLKISIQSTKAAIMTTAIAVSSSRVQVAPLFSNLPIGRGNHAVYWEGTDQSGHVVSPPPFDYFTLNIGGYSLPDNAILVEQAPQFSNVAVSPNYLDPFTGDFQTTPGASAQISFTLSKSATVVLQVVSVDSGNILRTITQANLSAGDSTLTWNGKADNGLYVAPGDYRLALKAADAVGNPSMIRYALVRVHY